LIAPTYLARTPMSKICTDKSTMRTKQPPANYQLQCSSRDSCHHESDDYRLLIDLGPMYVISGLIMTYIFVTTHICAVAWERAG